MCVSRGLAPATRCLWPKPRMQLYTGYLSVEQLMVDSPTTRGFNSRNAEHRALFDRARLTGCACIEQESSRGPRGDSSPFEIIRGMPSELVEGWLGISFDPGTSRPSHFGVAILVPARHTSRGHGEVPPTASTRPHEFTVTSVLCLDNLCGRPKRNQRNTQALFVATTQNSNLSQLSELQVMLEDFGGKKRAWKPKHVGTPSRAKTGGRVSQIAK